MLTCKEERPALSSLHPPKVKHMQQQRRGIQSHREHCDILFIVASNKEEANGKHLLQGFSFFLRASTLGACKR
jgi:hypothetical protein